MLDGEVYLAKGVLLGHISERMANVSTQIHFAEPLIIMMDVAQVAMLDTTLLEVTVLLIQITEEDLLETIVTTEEETVEAAQEETTIDK